MSRVLNFAVVGALAGAGLFFTAPSFADSHEPQSAHADSSESAHVQSEEAGHGAAHGHHDPHFSDINWFTGMIGEKEGVEPSLWWRPPGTPVPLGAMLLNTALLFFLLGRLGGPAVSSGLKSRKEQIAGDMQRASKMKEEAEQQLAMYEGKLSEMAAEMTRIKKELRQQATHERERVLSEAKARAEAMAHEAEHMVQQQLSHARQEAVKKAVSAAVLAAQEEIKKSLSQSDQERLAHDLLSSLDSHMKAREVRS